MQTEGKTRWNLELKRPLSIIQLIASKTGSRKIKVDEIALSTDVLVIFMTLKLMHPTIQWKDEVHTYFMHRNNHILSLRQWIQVIDGCN